MTVFKAPAFDDHEEVVFCSDPLSGLRAIIAIHSTVLGPAAGGCRMWDYASDAEALDDVLRLSRGMSYKNALADLPLGGGKAVILGAPARLKTPDLMRSFGRFVERLGGRYVTAEDVGMSVADMEYVAETTSHVAGRSAGPGSGGDPAPFTALGVYLGLRAAVRYRLGRTDLKGLRVAVQGLGHVGLNLCQRLAADGALLTVADINPDRVRDAVANYGAHAVPSDAVVAAEADVFAPCALGGVLNSVTIPTLRASVIAGAANNQLATPRDGDRLAKRGVLHAPDYVINAGGIINVAAEISGRYDKTQVLRRVEAIPETLLAIFDAARKEGVATQEIADKMARERIARARASRLAA